MLDLAFKNIQRQRTRTILTVLGIVIGIAAIVALGSFAEGINTFMQSNLEITAGKIMVQQEGSGGFMTGFSGSDITEEQLEMLMDISGVKDVAPVNMYFETGLEGGISFGAPSMIVIGTDPDKGEYFVGENVEMHEGRELVKGDSGTAIIGKDASEDMNIEVGDSFSVKETDFEVVGVIERTDNSNIDGSILVNIEDLQDALDLETYQTVYVIPYDVRDFETIAETIEEEDETLSAITSTDIARQASGVMDQLRLFTFGMGAIAAVIGGLGVMNTMIMAVLERRREIGVLKAVGATRRMIIMQFLTESGMISIFGGLIGIALGMTVMVGFNSLIGNALPVAFPPALLLTSLLFALFLGIAGGFYPARKAAKLDPVEALRYE